MQPVYFSHGYRPREAPFNEYFSALLTEVQLLPSLDPPSPNVNPAKLERNLRHTKGLVAVLTNRDGKASPYLLYEITMCLRAGKSLLVFVEDTLPSIRSEEHTSELQSHVNLVCRLLLEKKK